MKKLLAVCLFFTAACSKSSAAIVISGDIANGSGYFSITESFTLVRNTTNPAMGSVYLVVENAIFPITTFSSTVVRESLSIAINGNPGPYLPIYLGVGGAEQGGPFSNSDLRIGLSGFNPPSPGSTMTFPVHGAAIHPALDFPEINGVFGRYVFLSDANGLRLTDKVWIVPEASNILLVTIGALVILRRKRQPPTGTLLTNL